MRVPSIFSPELIKSANASVLCWLATVDEHGQPNVSPKEIFEVRDTGHIVIANIASPTSVRNVRKQHKVCVAFVDVFAQKGFKVYGSGREIRPNESDFQQWAHPVIAKAGSRFKVHSVVVIEAGVVEAILAPSYRFYAAETTEAMQVEAAMKAYGVQPVRRDA